MDGQDWRGKYITEAMKGKGDMQEIMAAQIRAQTLQELNYQVTFRAILALAVERKRRADPKGYNSSLYGTWSQHNSTKTHVFDEFRRIMKELMLSEFEINNLEKELDSEWGTGASLYFN